MKIRAAFPKNLASKIRIKAGHYLAQIENKAASIRKDCPWKTVPYLVKCAGCLICKDLNINWVLGAEHCALRRDFTEPYS